MRGKSTLGQGDLTRLEGGEGGHWKDVWRKNKNSIPSEERVKCKGSEVCLGNSTLLNVTGVKGRVARLQF